MCGRYAASRRADDLVEEFEVAAPVDVALPPKYNVAPTDRVYAVLERPTSDDRSAAPVRQLRVVRWGLVPSWAKSVSSGATMINARLETLAEKPAFRAALAKRRCLLPADGYFEWYGEKNGSKQPFFIRPRNGDLLAMAGLYEFWRDPSKQETDADAWLATATIITTEAADGIGHLHDRMPMLVERNCYSSWLDPALEDARQLRSLLVPAAPDRLVAHPVSVEVGNVRNDGPHLVERLAVEALEQRADEPAGAAGRLQQEQLF